jgi:uncharacterized integral membrane protein (TIGR00698 family)
MTDLTQPDSLLAGPWHWMQRCSTGVVLCIVIAIASTHLADQFGGSSFLYALVLGVALNPLSADARVSPGIEFCTRTVLRWGVALLGARITLSQISGLGVAPVLVILAAVISTILFGVLMATWLKLPRWQGLLSGGATAICGASAALAIAAALPRGPEKERFTLVVVVTVTALSTLAMVAYPLLSEMLSLTVPQAGLFLGGTIHDVAQVVAAGFMLSDATGKYATIVKLLRVALLTLVVAATAYAYRREGGPTAKRAPLLPWFLVVFLVLVVFNSLDLLPASGTGLVNAASKWSLLVAISALGAKSSFGKLAAAGWRSAILVISETFWIAIFVLLCIRWLP